MRFKARFPHMDDNLKLKLQIENERLKYESELARSRGNMANAQSRELIRKYEETLKKMGMMRERMIMSNRCVKYNKR